MSKFNSMLAGLATLALAAIPALAVTASAHAAPVTVKVSDLDLKSEQGARVLAERTRAAANKVCAEPANQGGLSRRAACVASVGQEVRDGLAARQSATVEFARR